MMGCEAETEFNIATQENKTQHVMYATEQSSCLMRLCIPANRGMKFHVAENEGGKNSPFLIGSMDIHCGMNACCCVPKMVMSDSNGATLGWTETGIFICSHKELKTPFKKCFM
jgi:hypothetical protein